MNRRRLSCPLTDEDCSIWLLRLRPLIRTGPQPFIQGPEWRWVNRMLELDRRDADRMLRIMMSGCRFCGSNSLYGEAHETDCVYVTDPTARRVWLRRGARIIE